MPKRIFDPNPEAVPKHLKGKASTTQTWTAETAYCQCQPLRTAPRKPLHCGKCGTKVKYLCVNGDHCESCGKIVLKEIKRCPKWRKWHHIFTNDGHMNRSW